MSEGLPTSKFERFRELVLRDRALFDRLREASDQDDFVALAVQLGSDRGCPVAAADVIDALQAKSNRAMKAARLGDLTGWIPIAVHVEPGAAWLNWCFLGDEPLAAPFFDQTIAAALCNPATAAFVRRTSISILRDLTSCGSALAPTGFIFHMSRCGSTLIAQMLAALPQNVVLSEASPIDTVLHAHLQNPAISDELRGEWLRDLVAAFGRPRTGRERHLIVKFDSWHVLDLPLVRRTFPSVPWVFVYRHPLEVMASHARQSNGSMRPDSAARRARVIERFCQAALHALDGAGRLVEYGQLPEAVFVDILSHFGVDYTAADAERMRLVSRFNAKDPSRRFTADGKAKQCELSEDVRALVDRTLVPLYDELDRRRKSSEC